MTPAACRQFYGALRAANPEPRTELLYGSPYQLLIAVILSAQATDSARFVACAEPLSLSAWTDGPDQVLMSADQDLGPCLVAVPPSALTGACS